MERERERVEHAAEDDIENGEDDRVEREPNDGERGEVVPGLGDLIGRLADDHHRARALGGNHPHRTADELWPDQAREPARHIGLDTGALALRRLRRHECELADLVHEHDADMAEMLELERQFLIKLANLSLRSEIFDRSLDETLGNLERGFDLDPRCRTGIEDRDRAGHQGGKEIDQSDGDQQLCSNCAVIPKLLQHAVKVSTAASAPPDHALHARSYAAHSSFLRTSLLFRLPLPDLLLEALAGESRKDAVHVGSGEKAMASQAIQLPNLPDQYWDAG